VAGFFENQSGWFRNECPIRSFDIDCLGSGFDLVSDIARYRRQAEECRQQAEKSLSPLDKDAWLQLAADWLRMVRMAEQREGRRRQED
jgi:hypothetical protein